MNTPTASTDFRHHAASAVLVNDDESGELRPSILNRGVLVTHSALRHLRAQAERTARIRRRDGCAVFPARPPGRSWTPPSLVAPVFRATAAS